MSKHHRAPQPHARRAAFMLPRPSATWSATSLVLALCLVLAGVLVCVVAARRDRAAAGSGGTRIGQPGSDVSLPVALFADGAARFYRYTTAAGHEIRFFVMKSADGVIRAAFDACDTCYRDRLGYRQQGDHMVCRKCGRAFRSVDINILQGGCNPSPLRRTIDGGQIVLTASALEAGAVYF